jgi:histidine triad (HIT) family protein
MSRKEDPVPGSLSDFSDEQLKRALFRVRTHDLLAFLREAEEPDKGRALRLLCSVTRENVERADSKEPGDPSALARIAANIKQHDESCMFCDIVAGRTPASFAYRDGRIAAFMDLYPITRGHLLIIPAEHVPSIAAVAPSVAAAMMNLGQRLGAAVMKSALGCDGYNLFLAEGGSADQDMFHAHLHVIPRHHADGFGLAYPAGYPSEEKRSALDETAETIKFYLKKQARS